MELSIAQHFFCNRESWLGFVFIPWLQLTKTKLFARISYCPCSYVTDIERGADHFTWWITWFFFLWSNMSVFWQLRRVSFFVLHNWLNYKVHPLFSKSLPSLQFRNLSSFSMIWIAATAFWSFLPGLVFLWPITFTALIEIFIKHSLIQKLYWKFLLLLE